MARVLISSAMRMKRAAVGGGAQSTRGLSSAAKFGAMLEEVKQTGVCSVGKETLRNTVLSVKLDHENKMLLGGGDPGVTTTAVDDRHQRRPALALGLRGALPDATTREQLYGVRTTRTWAFHTNKEASPGHANVNGKGQVIGKVMLVARRGFCSMPGSGGEPDKDTWRRIVRFYKWKFFMSVENWLWAIVQTRHPVQTLLSSAGVYHDFAVSHGGDKVDCGGCTPHGTYPSEPGGASGGCGTLRRWSCISSRG